MIHRIAALAAAALFVLACGGGDGDVDTDARGEAAPAAEATTAPTEPCTLPAAFPEATPILSECVSVASPMEVGGRYTIVSTYAPVSQEEAVAFFEERLPANGWEVTASAPREDGGRSFAASLDDARITVEIYPEVDEAGRRRVQYSVR